MYKRTFARLVLCCELVVSAALLASPASADPFTGFGEPCAILVDDSGTFIEVTNVGTVPKLLCHGRQGTGELGGLCDEAFSICVKGRTDGPEAGVVGTASIGLIPAVAGDPDNDVLEPCEPFVQIATVTKKGVKTRLVLLERTGDMGGVPVYDLSDQELDLDGDGDEEPLPPGTLVQIVVENFPNRGEGYCLGVRTTIQHRVGTCKIWKVRKIFNLCSKTKTITSIAEFELPCACGTASALPGPLAAKTAIYRVNSTGEFFTFATMGATGATRSKAGSVAFDEFADEFLNCLPKQSLITPDPQECDENDTPPYLELLLDFTPGGVALKRGQEKIVTFCFDVE